jgi:hypothetical protein
MKKEGESEKRWGVLIVNGRRSDRTDGEIEVWIILIQLSMLEVPPPVHHHVINNFFLHSFFNQIFFKYSTV